MIAADHVSHSSLPVANVSMGFVLSKSPVGPFTELHQHNEVELSVARGGEMTLWFGQSRRSRSPNQLGIFWGAIPHGGVRVTRGRPVGYSLHIPLPQFISWRLPSALVTAILHGQFVIDREQEKPCSDLALMTFWHELLEEGDPGAREIVIRDVETRLRRLARALPSSAAAPAAPQSVHTTDRATELFERMLAVVHARHREPLAIKQVARAAGISATHAMQVFRTVCGSSIHEYLTRCRIYTAQRLLITTDDKVTAIGRSSGFRSTDCFYDAFTRICGFTPKQYRTQIRGTA